MSTAMALPETDLLERVEQLAPLIRKHSATAERERRLSDAVNDALREGGFFRLFRPSVYGGFELDPVSGFRVIEALARIDSAVGWNVSLANACESFGARLSGAASAEIYSDPDTVMAGAFFPPRKARMVEGGYRVSGLTSFNSNCHAASWYVGLAVVHDGDEPILDEAGAPLTVMTFIPGSDVKIIENWDTLGMRGTGSHDLEVEDVFVPQARTAPLVPGAAPNPAYAGPFDQVAFAAGTACNAIPALGIAQAAIDELIELGRKVPSYTSASLRDRSIVQRQLAEAEATLSAARALLHTTFEAVYAKSVEAEVLTLEDRTRCQLAASHAPLAAARAVDLVHAAVGSSGIRSAQGFQRHLRDVHTITQHAYVSAARLESVGQVMLGLDPDWAFLHF